MLFSRISLPSLHDYDCEISWYEVSLEDASNRQQFFSFSLWTLIELKIYKNSDRFHEISLPSHHNCTTHTDTDAKIAPFYFTPFYHPCFISLLRIQKHSHSFCSVQTGDPLQSFPPWPTLQSVGGGAKIPCLYSVLVKVGREKEVINRIQSAVEPVRERSILKLILLDSVIQCGQESRVR